MSSLENLRILLVDDQKSIRELARCALEDAGASAIVEATNGEEALALLRTETVDLVISDWNMQPLDGLGLLKAVRADAATSGVRFIIMTGRFGDEDIRMFRDAGANNYVLKPFDAPTVRAKIEQAIR